MYKLQIIVIFVNTFRYNSFMEKKKYTLLKEKFGETSSFAIWSEGIHGLKSNTSDLALLEQDNLFEMVHGKYVLVDYKGSIGYQNRRDGKQMAWMNFHSDKPRQNDYKLRFALKDTPLWGAYITPLEKTNSLETNISLLKEELSFFESPILIALGGNVYRVLREYFQDSYTIVVVKHPSFDINLEEYRKEILEKASLEI